MRRPQMSDEEFFEEPTYESAGSELSDHIDSGPESVSAQGFVQRWADERIIGLVPFVGPWWGPLLEWAKKIHDKD
jgi:hypothetical protein